MAYTKQTWNNGDVITADKLNHMEDGIAGETLVIGGFSYEEGYTGTADKTWQEIDNALAAGARCVVVGVNMGGHGQTTIMFTVEKEGEYQILDNSNFVATATSADGYPVAGDPT